MALRRAHGTGADAVARVETLPVDELPPLNAADTAAGLAMRKARGRPFTKGNRAASGRKPAIASAGGIPLDSRDPDYQRMLRWARAYRGHRVRELGVQHGGDLSAGVCAILTSAALDLAASRYLTALAAKRGSPPMIAKVAAIASKLAMAARQQELTALEIASREAAARPRGPVDPLARWRLPTEPDSKEPT